MVKETASRLGFSYCGIAKAEKLDEDARRLEKWLSEMDQIMGRMQAADEANKTYGGCGPRLNAEKDPSEWLGKADGPKAKIENEKEQGVTIAYDEIIKQWTQ